MGQQQLLLIILGVIVVGIAVAVGISLFRAAAIDAARDAVALDLEDLAARAQAYYRKPRSLGGGERSFTTTGGSVIDIGSLTTTPNNNNGRYYIDSALSTTDLIVIVGVGREVVGTDTVSLRVRVSSTTVDMEVIN